MIRNRKSRAQAMMLKTYIAVVLAARNQLRPLTDEDLRRLLADGASLSAVRRARRWVEREYRRDPALPALTEWMRVEKVTLPCTLFPQGDSSVSFTAERDSGNDGRTFQHEGCVDDSDEDCAERSAA
jgi:hypothetical protein